MYVSMKFLLKNPQINYLDAISINNEVKLFVFIINQKIICVSFQYKIFQERRGNLGGGSVKTLGIHFINLYYSYHIINQNMIKKDKFTYKMNFIYYWRGVNLYLMSSTGSYKNLKVILNLQSGRRQKSYFFKNKQKITLA